VTIGSGGMLTGTGTVDPPTVTINSGATFAAGFRHARYVTNRAALAARDQVRTFPAAVWCFETASADQERNRQERTRRTLGG
jgi:predicted ATPase